MADVVKRALDLLVSAGLLLLLSPVLLATAIAVRVVMGPPVLFRQVRPGRHGKPFTLVKFRTMLPDTSGTGPASDRERLTPLGRWLRRTSVDELPQFWNVLRGEMSLVGPRPLLVEYLPLYSADEARRHEVRPGITGWAQVHGRNAVSWRERFALDLYYVEHRNLLLDLRILWSTLRAVVRREGINQAGEATMTPFTGHHD